MKLPSERIKEILRTPDKNGFYTSETGAILAYLDELHEQQKPCEHKHFVGVGDEIVETAKPV